MTSPWSAPAVSWTTLGPPSTSVSLPVTLIDFGVSSITLALSSAATGGSSTDETVTWTVAVSSSVPSEMVYSKMSSPLKFGAGS